MRGVLIPTAEATGAPIWDAEEAWRLDPAVALRPEPFGALAYHYGSRRLTFLRDRLLVEVVRALPDHRSAAAAVAELVPADRRTSFTRALAGLATSHFLVPAPDPAPDATPAPARTPDADLEGTDADR